MRDHHLIIQMCAAATTTTTTTTTAKYVNCSLSGTLLETRISSSLLMMKLVPNSWAVFFSAINKCHNH